MLYHNARVDMRYNDVVDGPARALLTVPLVDEVRSPYSNSTEN